MTTDRMTTPKRKADKLVLAMVGIFAMYAAVNGAMVWFTLRTPPQLVSTSYWDDATQYGKTVDKERSSLATGWRVELLEKATPGSIAFKVTDPKGRPVAGLSGTLRAYRPSDASLDRIVPVLEQLAGSGVYTAEIAGAKSGHWELKIDLKRATERLYEAVQWTAP